MFDQGLRAREEACAWPGRSGGAPNIPLASSVTADNSRSLTFGSLTGTVHFLLSKEVRMVVCKARTLGYTAPKTPFASWSHASRAAPAAFRAKVSERYGTDTIDRVKFSKESGLAEASKTLAALQSAVSSGSHQLELIKQKLPAESSATQIRTFFDNVFDSVAAKSKQASIGMFQDADLGSREYAPPNAKAIFRKAMAVGPLQWNDQEPEVHHAFGNIVPKEVAVLQDPGIAPLLILLPDAAQAALVGTFQVLSRSNVEKLFEANDALDEALEPEADYHAWLNKLREECNGLLDADLLASLQRTCNRLQIALSGVLVVLHGLKQYTKTDDFPLAAEHLSAEATALLQDDHRDTKWTISRPGGKNKRPRAEASGSGATQHAAPKKPYGPRPVGLRPLSGEQRAREQAYPAHLTFSALAAAAGHTISQAECIKRAVAGKCYLCELMPHQYGVKMCPECPIANRQAVQAINAKRTEWRKAQHK